MNIRVAARAHDSSAGMEQAVIRLVLTDHERGIVASGSVHVMHFGLGRQRTPECTFGPKPVQRNRLFS